MKKEVWVLLILAVGGGLYLYKTSPGAKRNWVLNWVSQSAGGADVFNSFKSMSDSEIASVYDYVKNYINQGKQVPPGSAPYTAIDAISKKYNVFT